MEKIYEIVDRLNKALVNFTEGKIRVEREVGGFKLMINKNIVYFREFGDVIFTGKTDEQTLMKANSCLASLGKHLLLEKADKKGKFNVAIQIGYENEFQELEKFIEDFKNTETIFN